MMVSLRFRLGRSSWKKYWNQSSRRFRSTKVAVQLDYYMSPQFAGIACAWTEGLYSQAGIDSLQFLSTCPVGLETERVRQFRDISEDASLVVGSAEQNVFLPSLLENPTHKLKAMAAIFPTSPLCVLSVGEGRTHQIVGAHEDTVDLLKRILVYDNNHCDKDPPLQYEVISSPRASKLQDLLDGKLDAIQAYTTTELLTLQKILESIESPEAALSCLHLEGHNGAKLGYSQVLFAPEEDMERPEQKEILRAFLKATFDGWAMAKEDPRKAAEAVEEAQTMSRLSDEHNDHWDRRDYRTYNTKSTMACTDLVGTGAIHVPKWDEAARWLLHREDLPSGFGLDPTIWPEPTPPQR